MRAQEVQATQPVTTSDLAALAAVDRYLSVPLVFGLLAAASFAIAWNRGVALMHAMFALFVAIAIVSALGARWMLRPARVRLALPAHATVGEVVGIAATLEPLGYPRRRRMVELVRPFPFAPQCSLYFPSSAPDEPVTARVELERRGVFTLRTASARCAYPIGLVTLTREWEVESPSVTVFPRVHPVTRLPSAAGSARIAGEVERPSPSLGQELFREVRDYRSGDNPRHIHWRSSAHRGHLVVRQFDAIATSETWIVLDLDPRVHAGQGARHSLEVAVEIAATLAAHLVRAGLRCGIAGGLRDDGSFALWHPPQAGAAHLDALMHALARAQAEPSRDYATLLAAMAGWVRRGQRWVLFNHGGASIALPPALRSEATQWFLVDTASFEDAPAGPRVPPRTSRAGVVVGADTDLGAIFG